MGKHEKRNNTKKDGMEKTGEDFEFWSQWYESCRHLAVFDMTKLSLLAKKSMLDSGKQKWYLCDLLKFFEQLDFDKA